MSKRKEKVAKKIEQMKQKREEELIMPLMRKKRHEQKYIKKLIAQRYYLARCNMIAEQLQSGNILELIDGAYKTKEFLVAEYAVQKSKAKEEHREMYFQKKELIEKYNYTEEELNKLEEEFYNSKIIVENYEDEEIDPKKASAENTTED